MSMCVKPTNWMLHIKANIDETAVWIITWVFVALIDKLAQCYLKYFSLHNYLENPEHGQWYFSPTQLFHHVQSES